MNYPRRAEHNNNKKDTLGTYPEESESSSSNTAVAAAAAAAGAEADDGPARNCGTAAVVYGSGHPARGAHAG